ncbi:MAG: YdcF family protein [Pseudomonadota bacterium]
MLVAHRCGPIDAEQAAATGNEDADAISKRSIDGYSTHFPISWPLPMRPTRLRSLAYLALALVAVLAAGVFVWNAARWLNNPDVPDRADAIVVLAGTYQRGIAGAELYRRGLAPLVYVSVPAPDPAAVALAPLGIRLPPKEEIYEQTLRAMGVPAGAIRRLGSRSLSTVEEAEEARRVFAPGARLLLVTSPFHVRRARLIFSAVLADRGIQVAVAAVPQEHFPARWWTSQDAAREVLLEWAKIVFYLGGGRFRAAP